MNLRLPDAVIERLDAAHIDLADQRLARTVRHAGRAYEVETRVRDLEHRAETDGSVTLHGYATVYDFAYDVAGGPPHGWSETIAAGACTRSIVNRDDVRFLFDHEGMPLARTKSRTLILESDSVGLAVEARIVPASSPDAASLWSAIDRGDVDEMSFAFQALRQEWNDDYTERRITECRLFDVSAVSYPANPATVIIGRAATPDLAPATPGVSLAYAAAVADRLRLSA